MVDAVSVPVNSSSSIYAAPSATGTGSFAPITFNVGGNPNISAGIQAAQTVLTSNPWIVPALLVAVAFIALQVIRR